MSRWWPFGDSARALVASSRRLDDAGVLGPRRRDIPKPSAWMVRLLEFYETNDMLKGAYQRHASLVSRVRWRVGWQPRPGTDPIPLEDAVATGDGPSDAYLAAAQDALGRVTNPRGGQSGIAYKWAILLELIAAGWLVGRDDDGAEVWEAMSPVELINRHGQWQRVSSSGASKGTPLAIELGPIWTYRAGVAYESVPDAAMKAALDELEELALWDAGFSARAQSRLANAGILVFDKSMELPPVDPTDTGSQPRKMTMRGLVDETARRAISTPGHADSVVPITLGIDPGMGPQGPRRIQDVMHHFTLDRPLSGEEKERIDKLERRLAGLLPLPLEIILGMEDVNHWNAWMLDEQGYKHWVKPTSDLQTDALTVEVVRPDLTERGENPEWIGSTVVYGDPAAVVAPPDRTDDLAAAYSAGAIFAEPYAEALGVDEEFVVSGPASMTAALEEPTDQRAIPDEPNEARSLSYERGFARAINEVTPRIVAEAERAVREAVAAVVVPPTALPAVTAAAEPSFGASSTDLGARLASIDRELAAVLLVECDRTVRDALRRAGAKLRSAAQSVPEARAALASRPTAEQVGAALGPALVAAAGVEVDDLFDGSLDALEARFASLVAKAQARALRLIAAEGQMAADVRAQAEAEQSEHRSLAWPVLAANLARLARDRVFDPTPAAPPVGEHDPSLAVAPGIVAQALAIAGGQTDATLTPTGAVVSPSSPGQAPMGAATGPDVERVVKVTLSMGVVGWQWTTGDPDRPFEPHQELDGVAFSSWSDEQLANGEDFPPTDFLRPGDHLGCSCSAVPLLATEDASV